jgi:hypothetical protein
MMHTFRLSDALRCILVNAPQGPNLACPRDSLSGTRFLANPKLWQEILAQRRHRITLAWWEGNHLGGLASARAGAGFRVWELDYLYLPINPQDSQVNGRHDPLESVTLELLEQLVQGASQRCAERIFLRIPADSPVTRLAQRAGFFPSFEDILWEGQGSLSGSRASPVSHCRDRLPQDDYSLFQLFSAATPSPVRIALGLTFDQWKEARELLHQGCRERVTENNGRITGWLSLLAHWRITEGEIMVHPDHPGLLPALLELALAQGGIHRWLVPDYQEMVGDWLRYRGFRQAARYVILVKTVTARVLIPGMAPVEA